ncbi:MAG: hypothetical protein CMH83_04510 [Nocardioides sp.]|nr:hypothetical protein [Nocardioides sp.]
MVAARIDGGGGRGSVVEQVDPLLDEILDLIGQLAGNEAVWRLLDSEDARTLPENFTREVGWFRLPGPYGFDFSSLYVAMSTQHPDFFDSPVSNGDRERILQNAIDDLWHREHDAWTGGAVGTVYRSVTRNVWEPDAASLSRQASALGDVTRWLASQVEAGEWAGPDTELAPQWLADLQKHWPATSESPQSFYAFWDDVNEKCALYLHATARLTATCAQVAGTVADFQRNLVEIATTARDHARLALRQWQSWQDDSGAWPTGQTREVFGGVANDILGGVSYGAGIVSLYGPAAAVAGPISVVTGGLAYLVPDQVQVMEVRSATVSSDVHRAFLADLQTVAAHMTEALDTVHTEPPSDDPTATGGFGTFAGTVRALREDWRPPPVEL